MARTSTKRHSPRRTTASLLAKVSLFQLALGGALPFSTPLYAGEGGDHDHEQGHESGAGGADDYHVVPAFFLSYNPEVPVSACMQIEPGFGPDAATLQRSIETAFRKWADYLVTKKLDLGGSPYIRSHLAFKADCDGKEDLTFYFGVENDEIRRYQSQFARPFGFAQLTHASNDSAYPRLSARGFVWIAPPGSIDAQQKIPTWNNRTQAALDGLILHELGHVFGNGHVDGTTMTEKIGNYLHDDADPTRNLPNLALYAQIDAQIELVPCMECHAGYTGLETLDPMVNPQDPNASDWLYTFKRLVGREPERPLIIRYDRVGSPEGSGRLTILDAANSYPFDIRIVNAGETHPDSAPLFLGVGGRPIHSFGNVYVGLLTTLTGEEIEVSVNYNMNKRKVIIKPQGRNEPFFPRPFFTSAY